MVVNRICSCTSYSSFVPSSSSFFFGHMMKNVQPKEAEEEPRNELIILDSSHAHAYGYSFSITPSYLHPISPPHPLTYHPSPLTYHPSFPHLSPPHSLTCHPHPLLAYYPLIPSPVTLIPSPIIPSSPHLSPSSPHLLTTTHHRAGDYPERNLNHQHHGVGQVGPTHSHKRSNPGVHGAGELHKR